MSRTTDPQPHSVSVPSAKTVARQVTVPAPPAEVFALLADPTEHARLDGSRQVQRAVDAPARLSAGAEFCMQMKGYQTSNTVVEWEQDALIAWRHRGRHIWRWELVAVAGGTRVTESFDYAGKRGQAIVRALGIPKRADRAIEATLVGLQARFA